MGFWDGGHECILAWLKDHKCKTLCKKLGLKDIVIDVDITNNMASRTTGTSKGGPLRIGFPSPKKEI